MVEVNSQDSGAARTQLENHTQGNWHEEVDEADLAAIDAILAEEQNAADRRERANTEFGKKEADELAAAVDLGQWLDSQKMAHMEKEAKDHEHREMMRRPREVLAEMAAQSEERYRQAEEARERDENRRIAYFNEKRKAREYQNWEDWVMLNTGPSGGKTASQATRKRPTAVSAVVSQEGKTIGKHAKWSLPIDPTKELRLEFRIGAQGGELRLLHVKDGRARTMPTLRAKSWARRRRTVGGRKLVE